MFRWRQQTTEMRTGLYMTATIFLSSAGEIGASKVEGRDRKIKLGFEQYMFRIGRVN